MKILEVNLMDNKVDKYKFLKKNYVILKYVDKDYDYIIDKWEVNLS